MELAVSSHLVFKHILLTLTLLNWIPLSLTCLILLPLSRNINPLVTFGVFEVIFIVFEILIQILVALFLLQIQQSGHFLKRVNLLPVTLILQKTSVEGVSTVLHSELSNDISPLIFWLGFLILVFGFFLAILIQICRVFDGHFSVTSTAWLTSFALNRDVLVVVNWDIVSNLGWSCNESLVLDWNREVVLEGVLIL